MIKLKPKALEAACKAYRQRFPLYNETGKIVDPWLTEYMTSAIRAYLADADLVERSENEAAVNCLIRERNAAERERDEALSLAETQGRQLAALREALEQLRDLPRYKNGMVFDPMPEALLKARDVDPIIRAALSSVAEGEAGEPEDRG